MSNVISERIADFLKDFPPFSLLEKKVLCKLAENVTVIYKEKNSIIFNAGEKAHDHFYVVHKGAVTLTDKESKEVIDICDEGDIFGLRPLMAKDDYYLRATTKEESILYAVPIELFRPLAQKNTEVGQFLIESFASNTRNPYSDVYKGRLFGDGKQPTSNEASAELLALQPVPYFTDLIFADEQTPIKEAAVLMSKNKVGCVLVMKDDRLVGIITDNDLRDKVVTGKVPITAPAKDVMTSPVITYRPGLTITQAQMAMMKSDIDHLILTSDGTPDSEVIGILSKHDIVVALGNNPVELMNAIKRAQTTKELKRIRNGVTQLLQGYLDQNIPMTLTSKVISELNDACIKQIIKLSLDQMPTEPPVGFAWLAMGSQGRSEQLLHTDQDNALLFENVPKKQHKKTSEYFHQFAKKVNEGLKAIGYEYCPANMMASNPLWCHSLNEWKEVVLHWMKNPGPDEVLLSSIFFDYNLTYGDKDLVNDLSNFIFENVEKHPLFLARLAKGALQNPSPSGFFRSFLLEQDGAHKDFFDLKQRALMPLVDGARVLILSHAVKSINNTAERFEKLATLEPQNKELYMACSYASKALLKFRIKQGLLHNDSGRFIALDKLSKEEKVKLKRTFKTIKELQELISVRFQTSAISV
ncbi:MAG: nucleotidyltransferase [Muricauda sp.]|nr:DUF294 nucleotidyltransferase-like domain-containing protein [Allomuricauda sp.]MBC30872.1 nucleotidyltransferase [Allomuricauda sp.]|tara:strand:- start:21366 stop:23288 length:1923 start_codon:yes stop_codon:yes gene_type:complete